MQKSPLPLLSLRSRLASAQTFLGFSQINSKSIRSTIGFCFVSSHAHFRVGKSIIVISLLLWLTKPIGVWNGRDQARSVECDPLRSILLNSCGVKYREGRVAMDETFFRWLLFYSRTFRPSLMKNLPIFTAWGRGLIQWVSLANFLFLLFVLTSYLSAISRTDK